jgi:hypothetical protein
MAKLHWLRLSQLIAAPCASIGHILVTNNRDYEAKTQKFLSRIYVQYINDNKNQCSTGIQYVLYRAR